MRMANAARPSQLIACAGCLVVKDGEVLNGR